MRLSLLPIFAFLAACSGGLDEVPAQYPPADRVFLAEKIYTGVPDAPLAGGLVVDGGGRISAILPEGTTGEDSSLPAGVAVVQLPEDAVMYPGFVDSHIHLLGIGQRELTLDLTGTDSVASLVARIKTEAESAAVGEVIVGRGWIETGWPEDRMPIASDIDPVSPDNPVILVRADGHALLANSAAMDAAGVDASTVAPPGGRIEKTENGLPNGLMIDEAMGAITKLIATPSESDLRAAYKAGADVYVSRGWSGAHNMSVTPKDAPLLADMDGEGLLPLRLYNAFDEQGFEIAAKHKFETDTITNRAIKLYMDGALGSRGALLIQPYADRPDTTGLSLLDPEALHNLMMKAEEEDVQLAIHAIGDLANRRILDTFEGLGYGPDKRWRIEHTQLLNPDDIARVGKLGLIASMQPSHAIGDLKFAPARLGLTRLRGAYAWNSLLETGAVVTGGSDAPVEVGSPLIEFYAAVARKDLEGASGEGWHPEEALSREQALALFTSAPAFASFNEANLGTLEVGKLADISVFDRDLITVPEAEILKASAVMTVVQGEIVFQAD